jgi:hypothetical protein
LIDDEANTIFGDFGAATYYGVNNKNSHLFEKLDVRAFGCLMEDLLNLVPENKNKETLFLCLISLKNSCLKEMINDRPSFKEIFEILNVL